MTLARGWKRRRAEADAKREARAADRDDEGRNAVRAARAAHYADLARADEEQAAAEDERRKLDRATCPCCGGNDMAVADIELVLRAIGSLPEVSRPDAWVLARLRGMARGHDDGSLDMPERGALRLHRPRPVASAETLAKVAASGAADPVQAPELREPAVIHTKPDPIKVTPQRRKLTAAEIHATADGALLELND